MPHYDPHLTLASEIFNKGEEDVTAKERSAAKAATFVDRFGGLNIEDLLTKNHSEETIDSTEELFNQDDD